jgi:voltage-gated potassium channel
MAHAILKPSFSEFLESTMHDFSFEFNIEEIMVGGDSYPNGLPLADSDIKKEMAIIIVGIKKKDGEVVFNPSSETRIQSRDILIAMAGYNDLERLRKACISRS